MSTVFIFKCISLDVYVEIAKVAIFNFLWSHVFSFSITFVTISTYCIIIVIGMLMCCHLPLAYDSLGRFSIENFLSLISEHDNTLKSVFVWFSNVTKELLCMWCMGPHCLTCLYFHVVVATQHISFDVYRGIAEHGLLIATNLVLSDFLSLYTYYMLVV